MDTFEDGERERIRAALVNDDAVHDIQDFADAVNVFSVNTLATEWRAVEKQLWKKENHSTAAAVKRDPLYYMILGKSLHELVQRHEGPGYKHEVPVALVVPYTWENIKSGKIIIWGKIDSYDPVKNTVYEFSTTTKNGAAPSAEYTKKVSVFSKALGVVGGVRPRACIVHFNPVYRDGKDILDITVHTVTDAEYDEATRDIIWKAEETARKIDEKIGTKEWKNSIHVCTDVETKDGKFTYKIEDGKI